MDTFPGSATRVVIVGGGFTGAAVAVQLVRASASPLAVTILEPREEVGRGMAYTAPDPDHRLNGSTDNHVVDLADPGDLNRWCAANGILAADPEAAARNGNVFIRRHDFGRYVGDTVRAHATTPSGSSIVHVRERAIDAWCDAGRATVRVASGTTLPAALVVIATGNATPRLPVPLAALATDARVIADPAELARVRAIPHEARVLLLGSGLTALDIASTLVRSGHRGRITAISRRGLRPRLHRLAAPIAGAPSFLARVEGPIPGFVREAVAAPTARNLLRALRAEIRRAERDGGTWYAAFDAMRDVVWQFWPQVPAAEKRRFQRWLRGWYDMHRFRAPPQNDAFIRAAEAAGTVAFVTARVVSAVAGRDAIEVTLRERGAASERTERFDAVVNCTGLDPAAASQENPFLRALLARGLLVEDASGMGFAVDGHCRPLGRDGHAIERLRLFGPPTAGTFGDPLGVLFIAPQVRRAVPGMLGLLRANAAATATQADRL